MSTSKLSTLPTVEIVDGVSFDTIAREWRMKWSGDNNKQSLVTAQQSKLVILL